MPTKVALARIDRAAENSRWTEEQQRQEDIKRRQFTKQGGGYLGDCNVINILAHSLRKRLLRIR